jgi:hypothetical protein
VSDTPEVNPPRGDPRHSHWHCDCPLDDMPCECNNRQEYVAQSGPMCRNCWGHIGPRTHRHVEELIGEVDGIRITSGHYEPIS